jgi:hypothetical protein
MTVTAMISAIRTFRRDQVTIQVDIRPKRIFSQFLPLCYCRMSLPSRVSALSCSCGAGALKGHNANMLGNLII